jgi:hypothetical protein
VNRSQNSHHRSQECDSALQFPIPRHHLQALVIEYVGSLDVGRASVKPASNRRSWNPQFREEIRIACLASCLADPVVIAASGKSCLHTMSYRHLDGPVIRIGFETYSLYKSVALQLQRANSRMSWNAAVLETYLTSYLEA